VLVLEREASFGAGVSARNSEVVHAGLYYAQGSRKARACVQGKQMLYAYCRERGVECRAVGKLVVATDEEQSREGLPRLTARAEANGVHDLRAMTRADVRALEPAVECTSALWSPSSGIVDSHGLMQALLADAQDGGADVAYGARVVAGRLEGRQQAVLVRTVAVGGADEAGGGEEGPGTGAEDAVLLCDEVVNCAGLGAVRVGRALRPGAGRCHALRAAYARGSYFSLKPGSLRPLPQRLIYPLPDPNLGGLGIHATVDLAGQVRFGPDVEWLGDGGFVPGGPGGADGDVEADPMLYSVDPARAARFYSSIRAYLPGLPDGSLQPDYAGVRPKLAGRGQESADFAIEREPPEHGGGLVIHLLGIESPGLTSALALAEEVADGVVADPVR